MLGVGSLLGVLLGTVALAVIGQDLDHERR
jgi:hypothetical protein